MGITPVLFSTSEAAAALGVDRRTIQRWVRLRTITPAKTGPGIHGGHIFTGEEVARVGKLRAGRSRVLIDPSGQHL